MNLFITYLAGHPIRLHDRYGETGEAEEDESSATGGDGKGRHKSEHLL